MFGPKMDEITEEWRKLHKDELNPLNAELNPICHLPAFLGAHHILHVSRIRVNYMYTSPNIVRVIKTRRMRWAGHVARMAGGEAYTRVWWGNLRERDHLGYTSVDGRIILRWIFMKWHMRVWTGSSWLRIGTGDRHL